MKAMTALATLSLLLALGCSRKGAGGQPRVPVTVARAEQRAVPFEIPATGTAERAAAEALQAAVRADSAAVANAQLNLEWARIRAPIAGRTGRLLVRAGNLVRANAPDPLVIINQIHPILVRFAVPERALGDIQRYRKNRLPVLVSPSKEDTTFTSGLLTFVDNSVDTTTGTVLLKAEFASTDGVLWPGEFLNVRLQLYVEEKAVVVPAQAVMTGQQGTYVFVLNQDGTARSQPVTVERDAGSYIVIAQGVAPGDEVVTDGQLRLVPGAPVEVKGVTEPAREVEADK